MRTVAALVVCLAMLPSCRVNDLAFRTDERVEIVEPQERALVQLPFRLRWTVEDFRIVGPDDSQREDAGYFAVLIDESPMPPGAGVEYFARDDTSCRPADGCPDRAYLADHNIFPTTQTSLDIATLADTRPPDRPSAEDGHEITIVLLNGRGERIGEAAFRRKVIVDRRQDGP